MTLTEALEAFHLAMVGVVAPATQRWYTAKLRTLKQQLGDHDVNDIDIQDLRQWRAGLAEQQMLYVDHPFLEPRPGKLAPQTIHDCVRACRRLFNWLSTEEGIIDHNPAKRLELPILPDPEPKHITPEDLAKLLDAARASGSRDYALVCFLADTGCRLGGLAGLRLRDLDLEEGEATVTEKGRRARRVYFGRRTRNALLWYLEYRHTYYRDPESLDWLWLCRRGRLQLSGIAQVFKRLGEKAGCEGKCNPHAFRHGWAKSALAAGADLGTVRQVLGHRDIKTTAHIYGTWSSSELAERAHRFSPLS